MQRISEIFGSNLFSDKVMREKLPKEVYFKLQKTIKEGVELELEVANVIANAMKEWAVERGATHFTHWFHPMTGKTAEKHEAFFDVIDQGNVIEEFSGKNLIMGEGDASSFPSGGLRATFEARGYSVWDCTSPAFIKDKDGVQTLCIPTAFCSHTGEALDKKTPLLRSMQAIEKSAKRILKIFNQEPKRVFTTLGAEQEYFLIDKRLYQQRKDIIYTGRTLFGADAPKAQDLSDHYYGSIKSHISAFMHDIDLELWKVGVTAKTKHNEVAPAQHEIAPIFTTANIASDQNQVMMDMLESVANRHNLVCLLHEKPFSNINGSGKHVNWSIATSDGVNLLEPGNTPNENTQFLIFLSAVIKAVDKYAEILRLSASSYTNDFRLGGHEAPPAIISIFVGEQLEEIFDELENGEKVEDVIDKLEVDEYCKNKALKETHLKSGVITLPILQKDVTDRNRTSPFAFTGNKFEFRMVGSSQTIADANIVLNTIVADVLNEIADEFEANKELTIKQLIKRIIKEHKRIIFNGNGYTNEWVEEAKKRGLPILNSTVDTIPHLLSKKSINLFTRNNVFNEVELKSRYEIRLDDYIKRAAIDAKTMIHIVQKDIIPSVIEYQSHLSESIIQLNQLNLSSKTQTQILNKIITLLELAHKNLGCLEKELDQANHIVEPLKKAQVFHSNVLKAMESLRKPCDELEMLMARKYWPFPTYGDILFRI